MPSSACAVAASTGLHCKELVSATAGLMVLCRYHHPLLHSPGMYFYSPGATQLPGSASLLRALMLDC